MNKLISLALHVGRLEARTIPMPFSMKISAMVRPVSFWVLHMSGGATVN